MKIAGLRRLDRMGRYRLAALLFGLMYILLITRAVGWPDLPTDVLRACFFALSTPAMALLVYNLAEASWQIYRTRRRIDKLLSDHETDKVA